MSLESAIADLVSASTSLVSAVNVTKTTIEATEAAVAAQVQPTAAAATEAQTQASAAATSASIVSSKLTAAAADYAAQKTTKGLAAVQTSADTELKDRLHRRDPARHPFRGARPSLVMDFVRRECHRNNAAGNLEPVDLSSFMTFTRASTATYVGPDGLIKEVASNVPRYGYDPVTGEALGLLVEEQRTNLVTYSMQSAMAGWDKTGVSALANTIISPAGDLTGGTVTVSTAAQSAISKSVTLVVGVVYTTSVYVKAGNTNVVTIRLGRGPTVLANADITLGTSAEAVHVGNGWYRCTITSTASDGTNGAVLVYPGGRTTQSVGNYVYIWGAQCEAGSFPTSYIPTPATFTGRASTKTYFDSNGVLQTAASGVAVTDYGYVDGRWVSKGLSLEPQATNVAINSAGNNTSGYGADSTTTTELVSVSGVSLTRFVSSAGAYRRISWLGTPLGTGSVAFSLYVKKGTGSVIIGCAPWEGSTGDASTVTLDLALGGVTVAKGGGHATASCVVTDCERLWRVAISLTYLGGNYTMGTFFFTTSTTDITLGGLQAETGTVATSYIPTTTAQVTRAADTSTSAQVTRAKDSAICAEINTIYNHEGGTLFASAMCGFGTALSSGVAYFYSSSVSPTHFNSFGINQAAGRIALGNLAGGTVINLNAGTFTPNTFSCIALSYAAGKFIASRNSANSVANTTAKLFRGIDRLILGRSAYSYNTGECSNGYIRQLTYFPRQLSDADLQALTILED